MLMLQFILSTGIIAMPFLIPVVILICLRFWPMKQDGQRTAMKFAWGFYGLSLAAFLGHALTLGAGLQEFFLAFWGAPGTMGAWCYAGYAFQALAVIALMVVVNWDTIMLFIEARRLRKAGKVEENPEQKS